MRSSLQRAAHRALITVAEETVGCSEDQLQDQQNRFEAGTVPRFNVLRAEVELANVQPDLIRARNNYLLARDALAKTLGLAPGPGRASRLSTWSAALRSSSGRSACRKRWDWRARGVLS